MMHKSVLLNEVLKYLAPKDGEIYVDATFGAGGYTKAILEQANCTVYAIDRDLNAVKIADEFKEKYGERFEFLRGNFSQVAQLLAEKNIAKIDGIVFDFGVSSMQFDQLERGFSFNSDAKLDMRMNVDDEISAFEVINQFEEAEIAKIIKEFGDEKKARLIAKKIVNERRSKQISSCSQLANIVRSCFKAGYHKIDPATRTFQAIRIFVNQELDEIKQALIALKDVLQKKGRLVAVSFHSLEDKIVKDFLKKEAAIDQSFSRYEPNLNDEKQKNFEILTKSAVAPSKDELKENLRSRSAKLRAAVKIY